MANRPTINSFLIYVQKKKKNENNKEKDKGVFIENAERDERKSDGALC